MGRERSGAARGRVKGSGLLRFDAIWWGFSGSFDFQDLFRLWEWFAWVKAMSGSVKKSINGSEHASGFGEERGNQVL